MKVLFGYLVYKEVNKVVEEMNEYLQIKIGELREDIFKGDVSSDSIYVVVKGVPEDIFGSYSEVVVKIFESLKRIKILVYRDKFGEGMNGRDELRGLVVEWIKMFMKEKEVENVPEKKNVLERVVAVLFEEGQIKEFVKYLQEKALRFLEWFREVLEKEREVREELRFEFESCEIVMELNSSRMIEKLSK